MCELLDTIRPLSVSPMLLLLLFPIIQAARDSYRLPGNIRHIYYTLNIAIFTENFTTMEEVGILQRSQLPRTRSRYTSTPAM